MQTSDGTCGHCGYLVTGLATFTCPECGSDLRSVGIHTPEMIRGRGRKIRASFVAAAVWSVLIVWLGPALSPWVHRNYWPMIRTAEKQTVLNPSSARYKIEYSIQKRAKVFGFDPLAASGTPISRRIVGQLVVPARERIVFTLSPSGNGVEFDQVSPAAFAASGTFVEQTLLSLMKDAGLDVSDAHLKVEASIAHEILARETFPGAGDVWSAVMAWTQATGKPYGFSASSPTVLPVLTYADAFPFWPSAIAFWVLLWAAVAIPLIRMGRRSASMPRAAAPSVAEPGKPLLRTRTVMFTDMKDYTIRTQQQTRQGVADLVRKHRQIGQRVAESHSGRIVKTLGDALLISFDSATDAALAGLQILEAVASHNRQAPNDDQRFELRIAVATGEVLLEHDDILGAPVNLASRIQQLAGPGELLLSETTRSLINANEVACAEVDVFELKGFEGKQRIFRASRVS